MKINQSLMLGALLLGTVACRDPIPCSDCDEADDQADEPVDDLPCGGADLLTDNLNCGSCGNECVVWRAGTQWEAGACIDGTCGAGWTDCNSGAGDPLQHCDEICTALGQSCVANGCGGHTALLFEVGFDDSCNQPVATMDGSCQELIPWLVTAEHAVEVSCCCDFQ